LPRPHKPRCSPRWCPVGVVVGCDGYFVKILHLHSVDALADDSLGMLGIADIAAKYAVAAFPPDLIAC
jgi:hypothetical protein